MYRKSGRLQIAGAVQPALVFFDLGTRYWRAADTADLMAGQSRCSELRSFADSRNKHTQSYRLAADALLFRAQTARRVARQPRWLARLERGELRVGTLDTFLIWRWSGGKHFLTDASMAARTLLMDIRQQQWSPQLCKLFGIPALILPQINASAGLNLQLDNGLILQASVGDQS